MEKPIVSVVRYEEPGVSVRRAVELCNGLEDIPARAKVFIKPNIVFWTKTVPFPKWGVITTSRVVEDMAALLKERGVDDITIGEGMVTLHPKDRETPAHAFETLGYNRLKERYGVRVINTLEREFEKVDLGDGVELAFNRDIMASDFVVDLPVMKTHAQTVVSLGVKNLKGMIDIPSRKKCHNPDPVKNLHYMVARLADRMPPMLTVIDGIFTSEKGPAFDGRIHRSNLLVASRDVLAADLAGTLLLGVDPARVPHLVHAYANHGRDLDIAGVEVRGESIADLARPHEYTFPYTEDGTLPLPMAKMGIQGLSYQKYDSTMCTYCSGINGVVLSAIAMAWKGEPWDKVEVLTGKKMKPTPGMNTTILLGKCMYQANKDHPDIKNLLAVKGCPPKPDQILAALHQAGVMVDENLFKHIESLPGFFMKRYEGKPEYDENLFRVA